MEIERKNSDNRGPAGEEQEKEKEEETMMKEYDAGKRGGR